LLATLAATMELYYRCQQKSIVKLLETVDFPVTADALDGNIEWYSHGTRIKVISIVSDEDIAYRRRQKLSGADEERPWVKVGILAREGETIFPSRRIGFVRPEFVAKPKP